MGKLNDQSVFYMCTLDMTDKASSKLLTSKAKEIVFNVCGNQLGQANHQSG